MAREKEFYGLHHLSVNVADREEAIEFYTEALGFKLEFRFDYAYPDGGVDKNSFVSQNGVMLELIELAGVDNPKPAALNTNNHFALYVKDIEAVKARLTEEPRCTLESDQVAIIEDFGAERLKSLMVRGLNGERIELLEVEDL
ncbi:MULTISPECIES: VOC family protein [Gordonibacter]|uniref:VOC family protein n=1 Tax=Gordonibacter faecis TaxID=3047475 RepID=A0ABT7DK45_9ACTN|nr:MULTISPECIES: VOC family protein [unclassified Gordonibacter]MDJ1649894.1 VOC family protein [Gordonibacter sp. KGMB12511]